METREIAQTRAAPAGTVSGYELLVELAAGGMATVYLARAALPALPLVALKRPHPHLVRDPVYVSMLVDEARLASAIRHPNVVRVRELGFDGDVPFVVMDYVEGASLVELRRQLADAGRALDVPVAMRIALDALLGLRAAHELADEGGTPLGIIHRDVSPHNVLVGADGLSRLTDFGVAKADHRVQVTRTHEVKGKLAYMAPERVDARRICTVQSDVFAMGVVLWETLAGRRLFRGEEPAQVLAAVLHNNIPRLRSVGAAHVPAVLDEVIARALSRDLAVRYPSAGEFIAALEALDVRVARREEVTRVVEAVFSPRMRVLHQAVRRVVGDDEAERLFVATGLTLRPSPVPSAPHSTPELFGALGTELASDRYLVEETQPPRRAVPLRWASLAVAGLVVLALVAVFITRPTSRVAATQPPSSLSAGALPPPQPRRVVVQLPIVAARVIVDDIERTLSPPGDAVVVELAAEPKTPYRLRAFAADGVSAEADLVLDGGTASADLATLVVFRPADKAPAAKPPSKGATKRNGFTKLQ